MPEPSLPRRAVLSRDGTVLVAGASDAASGGPVIVDAIPIRRHGVDLLARLRAALSALQRQARDSEIELTLTSVPARFPSVFIDDAKLIWAVTALVGNALRFVRRGNRLRPGGTVAVELLLVEASGELVVTITDDGPGLPAKFANVFASPTSAEIAAPALSLINELVRAQGGHVHSSSDHDPFDHGTKITLHIPLAIR